eukprot:scaffold92697_cov33-Tisochrysis_lutea.AAC.1
MSPQGCRGPGQRRHTTLSGRSLGSVAGGGGPPGRSGTNTLDGAPGLLMSCLTKMNGWMPHQRAPQRAHHAARWRASGGRRAPRRWQAAAVRARPLRVVGRLLGAQLPQERAVLPQPPNEPELAAALPEARGLEREGRRVVVLIYRSAPHLQLGDRRSPSRGAGGQAGREREAVGREGWGAVVRGDVELAEHVVDRLLSRFGVRKRDERHGEQ